VVARRRQKLVKVHTGRAFADALAYVTLSVPWRRRWITTPIIDIRWNACHPFRLSTHSAGGITEADLATWPDGSMPCRRTGPDPFGSRLTHLVPAPR